MFDSVLESVPLWLIGLLLIAACVLASRVGRYVRHRADRGSVAEEAIAINTVFLRAGLFDEPHRSRLQSTIRDYAHSRVAPNGVMSKRIEGQVEGSHQLKRQLWSETQAAVFPVRETELASYFVDAMNEALNDGTRRELSGEAHIPTRILVSLLLYLLVASAVLGYLLGDSASRYRHATTLLFAPFAISIIVILDLDRPRSGSIRVSQHALEQLVAELDRVKLPAAPPPAGMARP